MTVTGPIGVGASALAGVQMAEKMASTAASDLARGVASPGGPDIAGDLVTLSTARAQQAVSMQVERVAEQRTKALLSMVV